MRKLILIEEDWLYVYTDRTEEQDPGEVINMWANAHYEYILIFSDKDIAIK